MASILVIEDEKDIRQVLAYNLGQVVREDLADVFLVFDHQHPGHGRLYSMRRHGHAPTARAMA